jgi:putative endonuclease
MTYWVYILASRRNGTLYVGVTNNLERRIHEHREGRLAGFTKTYGVTRLVYYQGFGEVGQSILYEKRLKRWRRDWKIRLIEEDNPMWADFYVERLTPSGSTPCPWVPDSRSATSGMTPRWELKFR